MLALWGQVLAKFDPAGSQVSVLSLKKKKIIPLIYMCVIKLKKTLMKCVGRVRHFLITQQMVAMVRCCLV